jgi:IS605 OrfB family transposase
VLMIRSRAALGPAYLCKEARNSIFTPALELIRLLLFPGSQNIVVGDVSSPKLAKTRMAKSVLDSGWGMLKTQLQYKGQQAGSSVQVVSESHSTRTCSSCGALTGPAGLDRLVVRQWMCTACGDTHDRDVNAARNILAGSRCGPPSTGTSPRAPPIAPSSASRARTALTDRVRAAA